MELPVILNCINCETFLGVLTNGGLMVGNILIYIKEYSPDKDNHISCSACGEDVWNSIAPI